MSTAVYYFSGTGNSYKAAERLSLKLKESSLIPIIKAVKNDEYSHPGNSAGFVFPLYFLSFPLIVMKFIEKFDFSGKDYIFIAVTRGFKGMGGVITHMKQILRKKNKILSAGFYIDMPSNDVTLFDTYSPEKQKILLDKAEKTIDAAAVKIASLKKHYDPEFFGFMRPIRHSVYLNGLVNGWKNFHCDEKCSGCGICEKICPVGNIGMRNGRPFWSSNCQLCEGCLNFCPERSVQYGDASVNKSRYRHPDCSWKDLALQKQ